MKLTLPIAISAALLGTLTPASAEEVGLELNTYLIAWAYEHCPEFDYPEDLKMHAARDVAQASDAVRADMQTKMDFLVEGFEANTEELCEFIPFMLEEDEEE